VSTALIELLPRAPGHW